MSLQNLLGVSLEAVAPDKALVGKLLAAAERNIADARLRQLSIENRFDAAYKAIMQLAMVALNANGYRTPTSKPGHHQTAIQTLPLSVCLPQREVIVLDALRDASGVRRSHAARLGSRCARTLAQPVTARCGRRGRRPFRCGPIRAWTSVKSSADGFRRGSTNAC